MDDPKYVPQAASHILFNIWHPAEHWWRDGPAKYPTKDTTLSIDWFKIEQ
jgi:hypothetical protein